LKFSGRKGKIALIISIFLLLFASSFYASYKIMGHLSKQTFTDRNMEPPAKAPDNIVKPPSEVKPEAPVKLPRVSEVTISSVGDCTIGWDDQFSYAASLGDVFDKNNKDYSYFFKNTADIFKNDDITTVNLETVFTNSAVKAKKEYTFKAPPEFAKTLSSSYIEGVTLANNHTRDYLEQGFNDTKRALEKENIKYFGEGDKWVTEVKGIHFGFLGYRGFGYDKNFLKTLKSDIEALKNKGAVVIINFHWGDEGSYYPNDIQKYLAHYAVDSGADLIIGHHPHVLQGIERYKGKIIAYSLGNFAFGGNKNPKDKNTMIFQTRFRFEDNKLKAYGIKVIPCSVSSVQNINDYCPTPLAGDKKDELFKRINELSTNLNFVLKDEFFFIDVNN
jgi:hypothetical protein